MRYLAAYLLLTLGGNNAPDAKAVTALLTSAGVNVDSERVDAVIKELSGKDVNELIAEGQSKLASVPAGGAAPAAGAGAAAAGGAAAVEETKEEEKEESDDDMGFGLFD
ncbi:60s acidic ribosomal protein-domain-containing protein [Thamnocephalis sphaerospora]|uniref:60s acidic ribosomal protein-domain-containing protein n=1 Tax=Thamnocephalis sphaerospora TaxID=78915 RepID=A0A4V1IW96_9FUNG|nr:60s acidic ribosomal protein-domain-containing protein [Thamnocephalis sphaerospora]RKP10593.1 60s acidic ribosomal protein-domain-containing protein [Thamnocephalis sphaerospora]|eukprot:RKP06789.1 60s acidic ribosomal protein-domain-containing protein [Thamnocephalis sphaerospora]